MCTLLLACAAHPRYRLILAANRDEYYDRPTAAAAFWPDAPGIFAGRDLAHGGTWLGVTRGGRIAALTNYRDPRHHRHDAPSRGSLVSDFLEEDDSPETYLQNLQGNPLPYNGYNLLLGERDRLFYYSNRDGRVSPLDSGIHGISNHLLDTPWPKVERGKDALAKVLAAEEFSQEELFAVLADEIKAPDDKLPDTGIPLEWERLLSSIFIKSESYGTRSSTILLVDEDFQALFIERSFEGGGFSERSMTFDWRS